MMFLRNTFLSGADTFFTILGTFILTPIVLNKFGIEIYGIYVFMSLFSVYGVLAFLDLGLEGASTRLVADYNSKKKIRHAKRIYYFSTLLYLLIAIFVVTFITFFQSSIFQQSEIILSKEVFVDTLFYLSLNIAAQFFSLSAVSYLQGLEKYYLTKITNIFSIILQVSLIYYYFNFRDSDFSTIFLILSFVTFLRALGLHFFAFIEAKEMNSNQEKSLDEGIFKKLVITSSQLFAGRLVGLFYNQSDKIIIWFFSTPSLLAVYDIALKISSLARVCLTVINSAVIPRVASLKGRNETQLIKIFFSFLNTSSLFVMAMICAWISININFLVDFWLSQSIEQVNIISNLMLAAIFISVFSSISQTFFIGLGTIIETVKFSVYGVIVKLIISLIMFYYFSLVGLVLGTLVAECIMFALYYFAIKNNEKNYYGMQVNSLRNLVPITAIFLSITIFFLELFSKYSNTLFVSSGIFIILLTIFLIKFRHNGNSLSSLLRKISK